MRKISSALVNRFLLAGLCVPLAVSFSAAQSVNPTSIRQVKILEGKNAVEIEVQASDRLAPKTQVLTAPDRLVLDFPNASPGTLLRAVSAGRGEVKDVRAGLLQATPPVTRLVVDLKSAQSFQVFPYGRNLIIKVSNAQAATAKAAAKPANTRDDSDGFEDFPPQQPTRPGLVVANYVAGAERVRIEPKPLEVFFRDGLLTIKANKANLSEVLFAVQQRTGAEIAIPSGAEQEQVVGDIGPAPAPAVLASLLNGSKFNYLVVSAANDPRQLDRVILTPRGAGVTPPQPHPEDDADDDVAPPPPPARSTNPRMLQQNISQQNLPQPNLPQSIMPGQAQGQLPPGQQPIGQQQNGAPQPDSKPADDNTPDQ
jgi:hypothetical protein